MGSPLRCEALFAAACRIAFAARIDVPMRGRVLYSVSFEDESSRRASTLNNVPPLLRRWTFWTATGAGAVVATVGGVLIYNALQPVPVPDGDVVVSMP